MHTRRNKRGLQGIVTHGAKHMDNIIQKGKRPKHNPPLMLCPIKNDAEQVDNGGGALHGHLCKGYAAVVREPSLQGFCDYHRK